MISRRQFLSAASAASGLFASNGLGHFGRAVAGQSLTQDQLLAAEPFGNVTILHVTDIHAQLTPLYFREPSVNPGPGDARGRPPHLTDAAFRDWFHLAAGTAEAHALTADDFVALARTYGRMGGMDRVATVIKAIRAARGDTATLLLDGGDSWQGSWISLQSRAQDMVDVMSALKTDAMVGHWEFTLGEARVKELAAALPFSFLAQNIRDVEWQEPVFPARQMFERGGARIAVIGQAFPRTPIANPRWMIPNWEFGLREDALQGEVNAARAAGADVVVLLSHNGTDLDLKLATRISGIDIILSAHTHDALPGMLTVGKTVVIASGSHGKFVSRLDLDAGGGGLRGIRFRLIPIFADAIRPDPEMAALIAGIRAPFTATLDREIGRTETLLYRRGSLDGTFDDLILQAMLRERDAEIALSPGFRWGGSLLPGDPITFESLTNATAITYPACYRTEMTGEQLKQILEDVADNLFHPDPYFQSGGDMVRVGGMGYRIDIDGTAGRRISDMTHLASGKPIDPGRHYTVAGWASVAEGLSGPPVWDVVEAYVAREKVVHVELNQAVKRIGD